MWSSHGLYGEDEAAAAATMTAGTMHAHCRSQAHARIGTTQY
jgi:hypothetical protein